MNLNPLQIQAIESLAGPIIIKAGPGTGKTRTLTARIEHLISSQIASPKEILALTFTRKAAAEMQERLSHLKEKPTITTFHGLAFNMLQMINDKLEIINESDRNELLQMIGEKHAKTSTKKDIKELSMLISQYKNTVSHPEFISGSLGQKMLKQVQHDIVTQYNNQLKLRNLVDYDDLILMLHQELLTKKETRYQHVLVDEFQDTNALQYEVIKLLCNPDNLFVIGDPYQSIYSFRGADSIIFEEIQKDFPNSKEIVLTGNYRSSKEIIQCSSGLFPESTPLQAMSSIKGSIELVKTYNEYTEAEYILKIINQKVGGTDLLKTEIVDENTGMRFCDFAVIYRTHQIGLQIGNIFMDSGIPFQVIGGDSPYEKPQIQFITNMLRYIFDQNDDALKKVFYSPVLKIHVKILKKIRSIQLDQQLDYREAVRTVVEQSSPDEQGLQQLSTSIQNLNSIVTKTKDLPVSKIIHMIYAHYGIEINIDLQQYISCSMQFESQGLSTFVNYLDYLEEHEFYDERADKVTLMTMHAAKGLEFNTVFICGFEERLIPFIKFENDSNIDEERRLLYVAMTRAKQHLYLTYPQQRKKKKHSVSSFYDELSTSKLIREIEDEAIAHMNKKIKKWQEKKSQLSLF